LLVTPRRASLDQRDGVAGRRQPPSASGEERAAERAARSRPPPRRCPSRNLYTRLARPTAAPHQARPFGARIVAFYLGPDTLQALKREIVSRWGVIDLLDVLKEVDYLTGFTNEFTTIATRENIPREQLRRRLLLALFALGTNMGISKLVAAGEHGETEAVLRRTSTATTSARRSSASSMRRSATAIRAGGATRPRPPATQGGSAPGTPT
jgi:hypothetical protein